MRLACLLALLGLLAGPARAQLSGTYTLGPSPGNDVDTFAEIIDALMTQGVSGPVEVLVEQATYPELIELGSIPGASATNTVTFRGLPSGTTLPVVTETPSSGDPYVVLLQKASWVRFESLRFEVADRFQSRGTVLLIESDDVTISGCEVRSIDDAAITTDDAVGIDVRGSRVTVEDTEVDDGDVGIRFAASSAGPTSGGQILRNTLDLNAGAGIVVEDQSVTSGTTVSIRENVIFQGAVDRLGWVGIWVRRNTGGAVLARNYASARSGTGIRIEQVVNATTAWTSVVNNAVRGEAFRLQGNSTGIEVLDADRVRVLNNSVWIESLEVEERDGGFGLFVDARSSGVRVVNNILRHDGDGYNLDIESLGAITDLDYQVFEAPTATDLMRVRVGGTDYEKLSAYQADTGTSANTIAWSVTFGPLLRLDGRSDGDGQLIGQPEPGVPFDIDGDARNATYPYRGADEAATPLAPPLPPLSGLYTIGSGGDYASFRAAFEAIDARGLGGAVEFRVFDGTYDETIGVPPFILDIGPFPGSSPIRTVTFRSLTGEATLQADAFSATYPAVLRLTNVQNLRFENLAFRSLDPQYADVVWVRGGNDIVFDGCTFTTAATTATGTLMRIGGPITGGPDRNPRDIRVLNSAFTGGRQAINISIVNTEEGGFEVVGNTVAVLHPTSDGIRMGGNGSGLIRGNVVSAPTSGPDFVGIRVGGTSALVAAEDPVQVDGNEVVARDGIGISWEQRWLRNPQFYPDGRLEVTNNTVRMNGDGATVGLQIEAGEGALFAHNTVSVASLDGTSAAVTVDARSTFTTDLNLRNNVLEANAGRALVLDLPSRSPRFVHDENAYWSDGTALATLTLGTAFDGDCADLTCMRAASFNVSSGEGQDGDSVERQVAFVDAPGGDLRLAASESGAQDLAGVGIPEVATDLDGDPRSPTRPYRGADEADAALSFVTFRLKVYLEGAYRGGCGTACAELSTAIQDGGHLPLSNPYADPIFDGTRAEYDGTESVTQAQLDALTPITDWVVVELRETPDGPAVHRQAMLLNHRGQVYDTDGQFIFTLPVPNGDYHVVVYHRNHLPVMSVLTTLVDESSTITFVDLFRLAEIYGGASGATQLSSITYAMTAGDGSGDGRVTAPDFNGYSSAAAAGAGGYQTADYTLDGVVTAPDFNVYSANAAAGAVTAVPEN